MIFAAFALAIWLYLLIARGNFWRMREEPPPSVRPGPPPSEVAIIPARNESAAIGDAVRSLASQIRVIVVDDASEDETATRAHAAGAEVIAAGPLPPGWTGKMWAVSEGVRAAGQPDYFLLTDADIVHPPANVAGILARAQAGGYDLVSYMVRLRCVTFAEQALIPAFVFFFFLLYPPAWISDPRRSIAGAAGGCVLIRRETLERIGGIARIRAEVIDDCALARTVKQSGGRVWLGLSGTTHSLREYRSFGEIGRMIARTAFTQLEYSPLLLAGTVAGLVLTYLVPPALTLFAPAGASRAMAAAAWILMSAIYWPSVRYYGLSWFWAPLLPPIAAFYLGATVWSAVAYWMGRGGMWKGRAAAPRRGSAIRKSG
jgi:hopene-associated glycosyltransferase HpnB